LLLPFGRRLGDDDALPPLADPVKPLPVLLVALPVMAGMVVSQSLSVRWLLRPIDRTKAEAAPCAARPVAAVDGTEERGCGQ